ncbi:MAG: NADH-quinone oxidoreductase subunit J [Planctomycetes bacterium]|nr:NADH-quinone oxidoreductase subunit J [Planctomycetota bacterium]
MSFGDLLYHIVFYAFAILTVGSAFVVAQSTNILHSAFALLLTFFGVAGLYAFLGADFLAAAQLVIYVGGILILLIFAVMLTHKIKHADVSNETASWPLGLLLSAALYFGLAYVALRNEWYQPAGGGLPVSAGEIATGSTTVGLGEAFLGNYLLPFELASVALLAALVAAAHLARKEEPVSEEEFDRLLAASEPPLAPPAEGSAESGGGHDNHAQGHSDSAASAHGGGHAAAH